jgi:DNA-binding transcriptional LysR family regulator
MYGETPCNSSPDPELARVWTGESAQDTALTHDIQSKYSNYMLALIDLGGLAWDGAAVGGRPARGSEVLGSLAQHGPEASGRARHDRGVAVAVPHGLKLNQLRYVLSAAEQGSFRRAAAALNIQQSTVSRRIRELEDRLGAAIFVRDAAGVRLTRAGGRFLEQARRAVEHLAEAADALGTAGRAANATLRIGVVLPLGGGFLDRLLKQVVARRSVDRLALVEAPAEAHLAALSTRRLDVAFLPQAPAPPHLAVRPLWTERLGVAMRPDHGLCGPSSLPWEALVGAQVLVADDAFGPEIRRRLPPPDPEGADEPVGRPHSASADTLLRLAALGQGVVVLAESLADRLGDDLVWRPLLGDPVGFRAVWSSRNDKLGLRRLLRLADEISGSQDCPPDRGAARGRNPGRSP